MRGRLPKYGARLKSKHLKRLKALVQRRNPEHWMVQRAQIVLLSHRGFRIRQICDALTVDHQVVRRWLKRFIEHGFDGLKDHDRPGRLPGIDPLVPQKVATIVVQLPERFGVPLARWSVRELARFLHDRHGWQVSRSSLSRFLRSMALQPHRVRYWLNPRHGAARRRPDEDLTGLDVERREKIACALALILELNSRRAAGSEWPRRVLAPECLAFIPLTTRAEFERAVQSGTTSEPTRP